MTVDEALKNWAAWYVKPAEELGNPSDPESLSLAIAIDGIVDTLHHKEQDAIRGKYLKRSKKWTEAALFTGMGAVWREMETRKLTKEGK